MVFVGTLYSIFSWSGFLIGRYIFVNNMKCSSQVACCTSSRRCLWPVKMHQ